MDISFAGFCQQVFSNPVLMVTVVLTLGVIFVNGWTDAPNAIATCIATRCLKVRTAILMSAAFNFLGVLVMTHINSAVASTISNMVDFGGQTDEALIALWRGAVLDRRLQCGGFCVRHTDEREPQPDRRAYRRPRSPYITESAASILTNG